MNDLNVISVAVSNMAGGSGKSMLVKQLLVPNLRAWRAAVEDVNSGDGTPDFQVGLSDFEDLVVLHKKTVDQSMVVDIGASAGTALQHVLARYKRTVNAFDFWVVPVMANEHSMDGALKSVKLLRELAVPAQRILVLPNRIAPGTSPEKLKSRLAPVYALRKIGVYVSEVAVLEHQVFETLKNKTLEGRDETVYSVAADSRDFRALKRAARSTGDEAALDALAEREAVIEAAEFAVENLDVVWAASPLAAAIAVEAA
ncbi:MAG: hypothetical protein V4787_02190 [Pseudomonadota bacterium]